MYQQGNFTLTEGQTDYTVNFSTQFPVSAPALILTDIFNSNNEDPQDFLEGSVINRTTNGFSFSLITAPPNNNYVLSWMASDGLGNSPVTSSGLPVTDLPIFTGTSIPENTIFPAVVSNGANKSVAVRWNKMKNLMAASHQHNIADIADAGVTGISIVKANSPQVVKDLLGVSSTTHQHTSVDLTDSTVIGRSLITTANAASARALISAAELTHTHTAGQIGASALGVSLITATTQEAARNLLGVESASGTTVIPDNITGATEIGKSLLTTSSESNARTTIGAANKLGWETSRTLISSRSLDSLDFGCKFIVSNTLIYTIPTGVNNLGKIGFYVAIEGSLSIEAVVGVTIKDSKGVNIISLANLPIGFYVLENIGLNSFSLTGYSTEFQRDLSMASNKTEFLDALNLTLADLEATGGGGAPLYNGGTGLYATANINSENLGTAFVGNPAGIFFYTTRTTISINTIGTLDDTQSFIIRNSGTSNLIVTPTNNVKINDATNSVSIPPKSWMQFTKFGEENLTCLYGAIPDSTDSFTAYVGIHGNNSSGVLGDITKPFATVAGALTALGTKTKKTVIVLPGNYTETKIKCDINVNESSTYITFMEGANVSITSGTSLFDHSAGSLFISGGNFTISSSGGRFAYIRTSSVVEFVADINTLTAANTSNIPVIETLNLTSTNTRIHSFEAKHIDSRGTLLLKANAGAIRIKTKNLITGEDAVSITACNVDLQIAGGYWNCANRILSLDSTTYELNLYVENCTVDQIVSGYTPSDPILTQPSSSGIFRINGVNGIIRGRYTNPVYDGRLDLTDTQSASSTLIISNIKVIGSIVLYTAGTIILNSIFIEVPAGTSGDSISADTSGTSVIIYGTCVTNKMYNTSNISFSGGSIIYNNNFTI